MSQPLREEFSVSALSLNYPDPEVFVRSQWSCPRWVYLTWRVLWLTWHVAVTVASGVNFSENIADSSKEGAKWFIYYPHITFILTALVCALDLVNVVLSQRSVADDVTAQKLPEPKTEKDEILFRGEFTLVEGLKEAPTPCLSKLVWLLYSIINCSNILSTAWYWAVTFDSQPYAIEMVAHLVNSIFVVTNVLITATPVRILHFIYPVIYTAVYVIFTLAYHQADGTDEHGSKHIYKELDWDKAYPTVLTVVVGLIVVLPLLHCVVFALFTFRVYLHARLHSASFTPDPAPVVSMVIHDSGRAEGPTETSGEVVDRPEPTIKIEGSPVD